MFLEVGVSLVGGAGGRQRGQRLAPGKGCPLARAVDRRFAPRRQQMQPLLALASSACVLAVHVEAVGALVDLGGAELDELEQYRIEVAASNRLLETQHGLEPARKLFCVIDSHVAPASAAARVLPTIDRPIEANHGARSGRNW